MTKDKPHPFARPLRTKGRPLGTAGWLGLALLLAVLPLLSPASPLDATRMALAPEVNSRFGLVFVDGVSPDSNQAYADPQTRYDKAKASGAASTRWPIYWHKIESSPGQYDFASQDEVADLDIRNGLEVDAIIMGTPDWGGVSASDVKTPGPSVGPHLPGDPSSSVRFGAGSSFIAGSAGAVPLGLNLPAIRPDGSINPDNRWANFVYKTVRRYMPDGELALQREWGAGKGIRYWEMWNEPDFAWGDGSPVFWEGGVQNYYRLLKVGYQAVKAADPQASVLFGGMQYWSDQFFFTKVLDQIVSDPEAKSKGYFFDVVPFHLYVNPYNILNVGQWANSEMAKRGISKPVWVNETNIPVFDDPNTPGGVFCPGKQGTQDEQASFVIQASALALVGGVSRIFLFQLYDDNVGYRENYGLVRNDGSIRTAYTAYQVAATYFNNPLSARSATIESGAVDSVSFTSTRFGKVTVLWNLTTAAKTARLTASTPTAQLIDKAGNVQTLTASGNLFSVNLPGKVRYGRWDGLSCADTWSDQPGSPYILVEAVNTQLSSRVSPLPEATTQSPFTVSWTRLDALGGSGLYDVQYRIGKDGQWTDWQVGTDQTSASFALAQGGKTYYFRSRARLGEQTETYPDGDGDTFTTVKFALTGRILDNRGRPVIQASVAATVPGVNASAATLTDGTGNYRLEVPANDTYQVSVYKQGFGALPSKSIDINTSISYDFMLPPSDNVVQNGGFEAGLASWVTSGTVLTQTFRHTGGYGATLSQSGVVSQTVNVAAPNGLSTLSFFYRTPSPAASDRFEVQVIGSRTASFVFPLSQNTWQQGWIDTSSFQGPSTVLFRFTGQNNLWLDEVALGSSSYWMFLPVMGRNQTGW